MFAGVFVFTDHMSPRPESFNTRFNLLGWSSFLSWPIRSANAIPESLFWCSGSQNFNQNLIALRFVFVRIGNRPTSDLHAFGPQNLLTPNTHLSKFVCTISIALRTDFKNRLRLIRPPAWLRQTLLLKGFVCAFTECWVKTLFFFRVFSSGYGKQQALQLGRIWKGLKDSWKSGLSHEINARNSERKRSTLCFVAVIRQPGNVLKEVDTWQC